MALRTRLCFFFFPKDLL